MLAFLGPVAGLLGINTFRLIMYVGLIIAVVVGAIAIRQHYINIGWYKHKAAVEQQDNIAIDASRRVEQRTQQCSDQNGFWDVITQGCKMEEDKK